MLGGAEVVDPAHLLPSYGRKTATDAATLIQASFLLLSHYSCAMQSQPYFLAQRTSPHSGVS